MRRGENSKAIELLLLSLKHDDNTAEEQTETLQLLCELYFQAKAFGDCLNTGRKLKETYKGKKNEVIVLTGFVFLLFFVMVMKDMHYFKR